MKELLDVTIAYPDHEQPSFSDFICGRVPSVKVRVQTKPIPSEFLNRDYSEDEEFRYEFQQWVTQLWQDKDALLSELHDRSAS